MVSLQHVTKTKKPKETKDTQKKIMPSLWRQGVTEAYEIVDVAIGKLSLILVIQSTTSIILFCLWYVCAFVPTQVVFVCVMRGSRFDVSGMTDLHDCASCLRYNMNCYMSVCQWDFTMASASSHGHFFGRIAIQQITTGQLAAANSPAPRQMQNKPMMHHVCRHKHAYIFFKTERDVMEH